MIESGNQAELIQKLSEQIPGVIYQFQFFPDGRTCFPYASSTIETIYEVSPEDVREDATLVYSRIHPDDLDRITETIIESYNNLSIWKEDYRVNLPLRGERWLQGLAKPEKLEDGSVLWHGFIQDITQRKLETIKTQRIKEQFEVAIQGSNDGIWDWDLRTNSVFFSKRWKEQIGYRSSEIPDDFAGFKDLIHPDDLKRVENHIKNYLENRVDRYSIEFRFRHKNGHYIWILARGEGLRDEDGNVYRMAGSHTDITERKLIELSLQASEAKLQTIFNTIDVGLTITDEEGNIIDCNRASEEILGITKEQHLKRNYSGNEWKIIRTDGQIMPTEEYASVIALREKRHVRNIPMGIVRENGVITWIDVSAMPVNKVGLGVVVAYVDITDKVSAKEEILKAKEEAENANKAKSEFVANMSHEIRTPLNGVIGFTELLSYTPLNPEQKKYVENTILSANSLMGIINDILDFSKIEAGKLELDESESDIIQLLEETATILQNSAHKKGLELLVNIQPDIPRFIKIDTVRVRQVLINLLSNAIKFTPKGEVELSLRYTPDPNAFNSGKFLFSVRDTGIGITEEAREKIFRKFAQADASTTKRYGGTGLGLVIANSLVRKMGGEIQLDSEPGRGSCFYFSIQREFIILENNDHTLEALEFKKVLVVDDNPMNRMILSQILTIWGIESTSQESVESAWDELQKQNFQFDAILLDYNLGTENGLTLAKKVLDRFGTDLVRIPIILLHSSSEDGIISKESDLLNIRHRLTKPVKTTELMETLRTIQSENPSWFHKRSKLIQSDANKYSNDMSKIYRIMVVEDVPLNLELAKKFILKIMPNAIVIPAVNGEESVKKFLEESPDLILMDIQMPVMDGYEATQKVRGMLNGKSVPIIALTAGVVLGEKEKCIEAGMDDFLSKPISKNELSKVLHQYLH